MSLKKLSQLKARVLYPFPISPRYEYIFVVVYYVSEWVEAITTKIDDCCVVLGFKKK